MGSSYPRASRSSRSSSRSRRCLRPFFCARQGSRVDEVSSCIKERERAGGRREKGTREGDAPRAPRPPSGARRRRDRPSTATRPGRRSARCGRRRRCRPSCSRARSRWAGSCPRPGRPCSLWAHLSVSSSSRGEGRRERGRTLDGTAARAAGGRGVAVDDALAGRAGGSRCRAGSVGRGGGRHVERV